MKQETIEEPAIQIPIRATVNVLICGGGTAGCVAALAAARQGATVFLVESMPFMGGAHTAAQINGIGGWQYELDRRPLIDGIPLEIMRRLAALGAAPEKHVSSLSAPRSSAPDYTDGGLGCYWININPEYTKVLYDRLMKEAGIDVLLHASVVKPILDKGVVHGAFIESASGREAILADVVIDCTGDGDFATRAGATFSIGRPEDGACQPMSQLFTLGECRPPNFWYGDEDQDPEPNPLIRNRFRQSIALARERGEIVLNPNDILCAATPVHSGCDSVRTVNFTRIQRKLPTEAKSFTEALMEGREQVMEALQFMRSYVPGCEKTFLVSTAPMIGIRESRRILGDYLLTGDDVQAGRDFEDGIARGIYLLDIHNPTEYGKRSQLIMLKQPYTIPYRSLLPKGIENLLIAGRCISGDHIALASYRVQSHAMAIGEAAGTAAGLAAKQGVSPRKLSPSLLRSTLRSAGANIGPMKSE